jgi:7-carboxy-7-deazaguanine synthase
LRYPLAKHGVFWTLQGEGALLGEPMCFVRLAGCSVGCKECDTDYKVFRRVSLEDLVAEIRAAVPDGFTRPWVWLTGGEPTDHNLSPLVEALKSEGFAVALATAGVRAVPSSPRVDWVSVSPHSDKVVQRHGHEVKVVPGLNGLSWGYVEEIGRWSFAYKFIQPLHGSDVNECIDFVQNNPGWKLSPQAHKQWGIP